MAKRKLRKSMARSFEDLVHVTSLRLMLLDKDDSGKLLYEGLRDAWRVVAPRLTELRLTICFELVPTIIRLDARALVCLQRLKLTVHPRHRSDWGSVGDCVLIRREAAPALALWIAAIESISHLDLHFLEKSDLVLSDFLCAFPARNLPRLAMLRAHVSTPPLAAFSAPWNSRLVSEFATFASSGRSALRELVLDSHSEWKWNQYTLAECLEALRECPSLERLRLIIGRNCLDVITFRALELYVSERSPRLRELAITGRGTADAVMLPDLARALRARAAPICTLELSNASFDPAGLLMFLCGLQDAGLPALDDLVVRTELRVSCLSLSSDKWQAAVPGYRASNYPLLNTRCLTIRVEYEKVEDHDQIGSPTLLAGLADVIGHTGQMRVVYPEAPHAAESRYCPFSNKYLSHVA
jgi:hypothetical protein